MQKGKFKSLTDISKVAVIYSILLGIYEIVRIIIYVVTFTMECRSFHEKVSDYFGYIFSNIVDNYIVVPAGIIILALLCVKLLEKNHPVTQQVSEIKNLDAFQQPTQTKEDTAFFEDTEDISRTGIDDTTEEHAQTDVSDSISAYDFIEENHSSE